MLDYRMLAEAMLLRDSVAIIARSIPLFEIALPQFFHCRVERKSDRIRRVKSGPTTLVVFVALFASLALAEDFKTIKGKEYKNATIIRVEADGIVVRTKMGIAKVYFIELPKDVQERFHPKPSPTPTKTVAAQRQREPIKTTGWAAAMANPIAFMIFVVAGTIIVAGVVFAIVRSRLRSSNDASKV